MQYSKEETQKILEIIKQIDNFTHTLPLEESFVVKDPFGHWQFSVKTDCRKARISVANSSFSPSSLEYVYTHNIPQFYYNELSNLITHWHYIKGEIIKESQRQQEQKQKNLDVFATFEL